MSKVSEMLARVRELDAAATPGPWDWYDVDCRVPPWSIALADIEAMAEGDES